MKTNNRLMSWKGLGLGIAFVSAMSAGTASAQSSNAQPLSLDLLALGNSPLTLSTTGAGRSVAHDTWIRIRGFGLSSQAKGEIDFHSDFAVVNKINNIDLADTLGMDLDKFSGGALVGFNFGKEKQFHLDFIYQGYYSFDGSRDVGTIVFDGQLFNGQVDSSAELIEGDIAYRWDFWRPESHDFKLSLVLGVNTYYIQSEIEETLTGKNASADIIVPIPVVGLAMRWGITPNLYVQGSAAGLYAGSYGNYYDLSAEVGYDFNKTIGVFAGYRYWSLNIDWDDDRYDYNNGSIFAGVEVRF